MRLSRQLEADDWRCFCGRVMEMAELAQKQQARLGVFEPVFKHHPREPATPIYPTVPRDCETLGAVCRAVNAIVRTYREKARQA